MQNNKPKVIVIGAGPAGILSCKYLKNNAEVICFEGNSTFGGQWLQTKSLSEEQKTKKAYQTFYKTHQSSLYKWLQTDIPYQVMTYKGFPHQKKYEKSQFIMPEEFYQYLQQYVKHHDLEKYMKFNTFVQKVGKFDELDEQTKVKIQRKNNEKLYIQVCETQSPDKSQFYVADYVMVCSGHNTIPNIPDFTNKEKFKGKIIHTHYILDESINNEVAGKRVVVQGTRNSAIDQVVYLCKLDKKPQEVIWIGFGEQEFLLYSRASDYQEYIQSGILQIKQGRVIEGTQYGLVLSDKTVLENVDVLIQATGYKYSYPFLNSNITTQQFSQQEEKVIRYFPSEDNKNEINHKFFGPIYKRIFAINEPNIMFLALIERALGTQQAIERTVIAATQYILGKAQLPSKETMLQEWNNDIEISKTVNPRMREFYEFGIQKFTEAQYMEDLAKFSRIELDQEFEKLRMQAIMTMMPYFMAGNLVTHRNIKIENFYVPKEGLF